MTPEQIAAFFGATPPSKPLLTKRELFAAMAMQGLLASCASKVQQPFTLAPDAVNCADALCAALAKANGEGSR